MGIHADIRTIKNDVKDNSSKVNIITSKIEELERNNERSEIENKRKFEDLKTGIALVEKSVTSKVIESIEPQISTLKTDLSSEMRSEMKQMLKEEMEKTYQIKKKSEDDEEASSEEEADEPKGETGKKKIENQKKILKIKNLKKS